MPEENEETKETQEIPENPNEVSTPEDLEAIKAELEKEKKAKAAAEAALAVKEANAQAMAKYLDAVRLANPTIPEDIIAGDTIEAIDASVEKAQSIASAVRQSLEAEAKEAKVPAGAPPRGEISLEGLTPREKIAAGIQQK